MKSKVSRFNHSCCANAEHFWNEDLQAREVTALKKNMRRKYILVEGEVYHLQVRSIKAIDEGEEVTLNYRSLSYSEIIISLTRKHNRCGE